jgi:hypothetical protein
LLHTEGAKNAIDTQTTRKGLNSVNKPCLQFCGFEPVCFYHLLAFYFGSGKKPVGKLHDVGRVELKLVKHLWR